MRGEPRPNYAERRTNSAKGGMLGDVTMPFAPTANRWGPVAMVLGSCVSLQFGAAIAAQLFPAMGPFGVTFVRLALAAVILLAIARPALRAWQSGQWRAVVLLGVALAGMNGSFYASIDRIPLGSAVTIEFIGPLVLAAILSRRLRDLGWVVLAGLGIAVLAIGEGSLGAGLDPLGMLFALIAGGFWAAYILAGAKVADRVPGLSGLAMSVAIAAVVVAPIGVPGAIEGMTSSRVVVLAIATAVLASVIPYSLELRALRSLSPAAFGILLSLEPAVATLAGWLILHQHIGLTHVIAMLAVIGASVGSTLTAQRSPAPVPSS